MVKNALQAQLLKAGLVDNKKAKQITKQNAHAKRTGDQTSDEIKKALAESQAEKLKKDQQLNQEKQSQLEEKALKANIKQMIEQHQIKETAGDVHYQFIDAGKIKKIYVKQDIYDKIVAGYIAIATHGQAYALLPRPLAEKIEQRCTGFIVILNTAKQDQTQIDEEDPYAAYVIPDDLMW